MADFQGCHVRCHQDPSCLQAASLACGFLVGRHHRVEVGSCGGCWGNPWTHFVSFSPAHSSSRFVFDSLSLNRSVCHCLPLDLKVARTWQYTTRGLFMHCNVSEYKNHNGSWYWRITMWSFCQVVQQPLKKNRPKLKADVEAVSLHGYADTAIQ